VTRTLVALVTAALLVAASPAAGGHAQTPSRGGTVVVGPIGEPTCLNPLVPACLGSGLTFFWIVEKVLTPALVLAPNSTLQPRLVSHVDYTRKPPFTLTYHIRPEARWSDGVDVTARDFVFTHAALRKQLARDPGFAIHSVVRSIRAVDAKTVRLVLGSRTARWRFLFAILLPRHALRGQRLARVWRDGIDDPKTGSPIGNGPFLVGEWKRGEHLTLVRNPRYWGPHVARLDRLVVRFQKGGPPPPGQLLQALRRGDVDFAVSRDTGIVPDLRRMPGIRVSQATTNGWEHVDIRVGPGGHPALANKLVRRALAYGIDRVAIVRQLFGELDQNYPPSDSAVFQTSSEWYRPNWEGFRYRPRESRRLLEQAGCRRGGDGIYVCDGARLQLRLVTTAGSRLRERHIQLMQTQLRQAGVEVVLSFAVGSALFDQILPSGDFDLASFTWFVTPGEGWKGVYGCGGVQNYSGYCQRLLTKELDQVERILDARARGRALNRADRHLARDVPVIPLYEVPFVLALRRTVQNVVVSPNNLLWNAEDWWLAQSR
jgi:peptide/nickel transport system substrate-binding protein